MSNLTSCYIDFAYADSSRTIWSKGKTEKEERYKKIIRKEIIVGKLERIWSRKILLHQEIAKPITKEDMERVNKELDS